MKYLCNECKTNDRYVCGPVCHRVGCRSDANYIDDLGLWSYSKFVKAMSDATPEELELLTITLEH